MDIEYWSKWLPLETEQSKARLAVCKTCPSYDHKLHRCRECGCFMDIKTRFDASKCPLNKWEDKQ